MEHPERGSCQRPMPGLTEHMLPQGSPTSPWDRPQRMPPITTCLPALGKRRGKKGRSSPRQVLRGAVVSEGAAGTAGMLGWLGREGGKRWWWWWYNSQGCPTLDPALSGCADCRSQSGNQNERLPQRNACRETDRRTDGRTDRQTGEKKAGIREERSHHDPSAPPPACPKHKAPWRGPQWDTGPDTQVSEQLTA